MIKQLYMRLKRWFIQGGAAIEVRPAETEEITVLTPDQAWKTSWVRSAIKRIAETAASVPLNLYDAQNQPLPDNHPAVRLLDSPNPYHSIYDLIELCIVDLLLFGNAYWLIEYNRLKRPSRLWRIIPSSVQLQINGRDIQSYTIITSEGQLDVSQEEIVHFKLPNPFAYFVGAPLLDALAMTVRLDRETMLFNYDLFKHGVVPGGLLSFKSMLSKEEAERIENMLRERYGRGRRFRWLILSQAGDVTVQPFTAVPKDMAFEELRKMNREEILSVLGVPPTLSGVLEHVNYATSKTEERIFWRNTVIPILHRLEHTITNQLVVRFNEGLWCQFDVTKVEALRPDLEAMSQTVTRLVQWGVLTINEARELLGYDKPLPWGDEWWGPPTLVPLATLSPEPTARQQASLAFHHGSFESKDARRMRHWVDFLKRQSRIESNIKSAIDNYAEDLRLRLSRRFHDVFSKRQKQADWIVNLIFDVDEESSLLWNIIEPHLLDADKIGLQALQELFRLRPDLTLYDPAVSARMASQKKRIRWIGEETWRDLRQTLTEGLEAGEGVDNLSRRISETIGRLETYRAERIARTESVAVINGAFNDGMKAAGVNKKQWLSALDERTRETHERAHGQVRLVGEPFVVGNFLLRYPGDPEGEASEVINCRCTLIPAD